MTGLPDWYVPGTAMSRFRTAMSLGETYCSSITLSNFSCLPSLWKIWR